MNHPPITRKTVPWRPLHRTAPLAPNEIHVIAIALDAPSAAIRALVPTLAAQERERAARFHFLRDRDRFLIGRAALRGLLAHYTQRPATDLALEEGPRGKPRLVGDSGAILHFNVSHAGGLALIGLTRLAELGVDVERIDPMPDLLEVAARFFAPAEYAAVRELDGAARVEAFFSCWTRKEAYIKAIGEGLACPLDRFVVTVRADEVPRILTIDGDAPAASAWTLADLRPAPGYAGAVAIRALNPDILLWRW